MENEGGFTELLATFDLSLLDFQMIMVFTVLFYLYTVVASKFLFRPLLELFEARERATVGAETSASDQIAEADRLEQEYETQLTEARVAAVQEKLQKLDHANREASSVLSQAENTARDEIVAARAKLAESRARLREELFQDVDKMADELVDQLKQPLTPSPRTSA